MKTVNDYFNLAKEIHDDNVKAGWWSKPRSKECFYQLVPYIPVLQVWDIRHCF